MAWWDRFSRRERGRHEAPETGARALSDLMTYYTTFPFDGRETVGTAFPSYVTNGYQSNGVVFAVANQRLMLFSQAEFKWQDLATRRLYGTPDLMPLEQPWPAGTSGDLLARMIQDVDFAGNAFVRDTGDGLERMRPDLVDIVSVDRGDGALVVTGFAYWRAGRGGDADYYPVDQVAHWAPIPDPLSPFRGMSWLTPIVREVDADAAMTDHRLSFFRNAATPNLLVRVPGKMQSEQLTNLSKQINARHGGAMNAWRTMVIDEGADVTTIGMDFEKMAFTAVQAAGEVRVALAAGVPPQVVGIQSGLDAGTFANYDQAFKAFGNVTMAYLWQSAMAALAKLVEAPVGARLWYDAGNIPSLQDAELARAEAQQVNASAISTLIQAGYKPDTAVGSVVAGDSSLLVGGHTGLVSVQMQAPGSSPSEPAKPEPMRLAVSVDARQEPPTVDVHNHVDAPAAPVVNVENRYDIDATTHIADDAIRVDARTTVQTPEQRAVRKVVELDDDGRIRAITEEPQ
jgi:phage portal protein BeeE